MFYSLYIRIGQWIEDIQLYILSIDSLVPISHIDEDICVDKTVLARYIITLVKNEKLRKILGNNARKKWETHYTAKRMAKETFNLYRQVSLLP